MIIELNEKQAKLIALALEQHSRMLCGQIELSKIKSIENTLYRDVEYNDELWKRRDSIDEKLDELKKLVFPELLKNQSYGIGKFEEADLGYEIYKQILYFFECEEQKEKEIKGEFYNTNVNSYSPLKLTNEPLIKITK